MTPYRVPPWAAIPDPLEHTARELFELSCAAIEHFNRNCPLGIVAEPLAYDHGISRIAIKHGPRFLIFHGLFSVEFCCQDKWNEMWAGKYLPWIFRQRWKRRMKKLAGRMFSATPMSRPR